MEHYAFGLLKVHARGDRRPSLERFALGALRASTLRLPPPRHDWRPHPSRMTAKEAE
jgi:hypothetical protein